MADTTPMNRDEAIKKLGGMIKEIDMAMLTTIDANVLRSRPMSTQSTEFDGTLWFMTSSDSHKMSEIEKDNRVNVSYADTSDNTYVSVSGTGTLVTDRAKIEEFWNPIYKAWFPKGLDDPTICLLKVDVHQAEYWDTTSSTLHQIVGFIKAVATGKEADVGDHGQVKL